MYIYNTLILGGCTDIIVILESVAQILNTYPVQSASSIGQCQFYCHKNRSLKFTLWTNYGISYFYKFTVRINTTVISSPNFWDDEAWWFLSLRPFGLLSSSLLLYSQCFRMTYDVMLILWYHPYFCYPMDSSNKDIFDCSPLRE